MIAEVAVYATILGVFIAIGAWVNGRRITREIGKIIDKEGTVTRELISEIRESTEREVREIREGIEKENEITRELIKSENQNTRDLIKSLSSAK